MKTYTVIGGVNGVGKSSLSGLLAVKDLNLGLVIDTDKLTASYGGDKIKGGKEAIRLIEDCLSKGRSFTQEATLSGVRTLKTIQRANELGYFVKLYYVGINSLDDSIKRIQNRVEKGGHDIPTEDVKRRYNKRFEDLAKVLPYCSEAEFYDNENGFCEAAEYRNGTLIFTAKDVPAWLKEFSDLYL